MILTLATDLGPLILREARSAKVPSLGQQVRLVLDPDHVHLFDPVSEQRIE